jgi:hypothetical protein
VRHRIVTLLIRDSERRRPIQALTNTYAQNMVAVGEGGAASQPGIRAPREDVHGLGCAVGDRADSGLRTWRDEYGQPFAVHWVVEPGRHEYHTSVTRMMNLRYDTTIHAIDVHLHPFAESLELRDVTRGETLFESHTRQRAGGVGLEHVDLYSSAEGIPVYRDHQYALVATYDNPTGRDQDAMALMYLGIRDPEFDAALVTRGPDDALRAERERRRLEDAAARWERAAADDPADHAAHYRWGLALAQLGRVDAAIAALERALELRPDLQEARAALAGARARRDGAAPADAGAPPGALPNSPGLD